MPGSPGLATAPRLCVFERTSSVPTSRRTLQHRDDPESGPALSSSSLRMTRVSCTGPKHPTDSALLLTWRTNSQKPYGSNSAGSDGDLAWFDVRIIRAMQSSARPRQDG